MMTNSTIPTNDRAIGPADSRSLLVRFELAEFAVAVADETSSISARWRNVVWAKLSVLARDHVIVATAGRGAGGGRSLTRINEVVYIDTYYGGQ